MNETSVPETLLNRLAVLGESIRRNALSLRAAVAYGRSGEAQEGLLALSQTGHAITRDAVAAGALMPAELDRVLTAGGPDLGQLNTEKSRAYLAAIEAAHAAAVALDIERNHDPECSGLAAALEGFVEAARAEVLGNPGLGLE